MRILVTGGAGFVGRHLVSKLLSLGHSVTTLDNLDNQVHKHRPKVEGDFFCGDVTIRNDVLNVLSGVEVVYHLAAVVGVGQSMYEPAYYTMNNNYGTAVLLECLTNSSVNKLIVASSMSLYGEGKAVTEDTPPSPENVYALSKYDQEKLCLIMGRAYGIETTALRFFNIYGPGQSLSNPYTGVMAIFCSQALNNQPLQVFEDGLQTRDFVSVHDIVDGLVLSLDGPSGVYNLGTGRPTTIKEVAEAISPQLNITHKYRKGDIRHCYANIDKANKQLGYEPKVRLASGIAELLDWTKKQSSRCYVPAATKELEQRGLLCTTKTESI